MKKFGLVGGVGYVSTLEYYKLINEGYQKRSTHHSKSGENPPMTIESLNLAEAYAIVNRKDWKALTKLCADAVAILHGAGAEFAAIAANTAHIVFDEIQKESKIPLIGIVDETCKSAKAQGLSKLVIFGTAFTMNSGMYEAKCAQYGLEAVVPDEEDKKKIHDIIFPNLEAGVVLEDEKRALLDIAGNMIKKHNADGLVLGCTELPLAIKTGDLGVALLDTGIIHVEAILDYLFSQ